jgi:hypothetical protein
MIDLYKLRSNTKKGHNKTYSQVESFQLKFIYTSFTLSNNTDYLKEYSFLHALRDTFKRIDFMFNDDPKKYQSDISIEKKGNTMRFRYNMKSRDRMTQDESGSLLIERHEFIVKTSKTQEFIERRMINEKDGEYKYEFRN